MMIDFAVEAERSGKTAEESIYQACSASVPPHHDDDDGGVVWRVAAHVIDRHRLGNCAARWESASWAALMVSQVLTLFTTPVNLSLHGPPAATDSRGGSRSTPSTGKCSGFV